MPVIDTLRLPVQAGIYCAPVTGPRLAVEPLDKAGAIAWRIAAATVCGFSGVAQAKAGRAARITARSAPARFIPPLVPRGCQMRPPAKAAEDPRSKAARALPPGSPHRAPACPRA